jgi:hypothetical protein
MDFPRNTLLFCYIGYRSTLLSLVLIGYKPGSVTFLYQIFFPHLHGTNNIIRTIEALRIHHSLASLYGRIAIGFYLTTIVSSFLLVVLSPT